MIEKSKLMPTQALTNEDGDVRELTHEDFKLFRPIQEVDPGMVQTMRKSRGRPPLPDPKIHIGFRLAGDVVDAIRATGPGYNARVEKVLRTALSKGEL